MINEKGILLGTVKAGRRQRRAPLLAAELKRGVRLLAHRWTRASPSYWAYWGVRTSMTTLFAGKSTLSVFWQML
jgi:hypothetical protein